MVSTLPGVYVSSQEGFGGVLKEYGGTQDLGEVLGGQGENGRKSFLGKMTFMRRQLISLLFVFQKNV